MTQIENPSLFVSIVMPAFNEEAYIQDALETIADISPQFDYELLVMDGGSTDATRELVLEAARNNQRISLHINPKRLQSAAVNEAEKLADPRARIILRADCHAVYPPSFVETCCRTLMETRAASVVVPLDIVGATCFQRAVAALQKSRLGNGGGDNLPLRKSGFVEQGHHAAFDRLLFQSVKGYDETFSHNEDSELDIRIAATGGRIWLEASVPVTYFARSNMRGLIHQYFNYGVGRARTIKKHRMHLKLRQAAPLLTSIISFSFLTISFTNAWFLIFPSLYAGVCFAFGVFTAFRHGDPCLLAIGPAAIAMHFSWAAGFIVGIFRS